MIKIKFHKDFISRYESFLNSIVFNKQSDYSKSIYWDYHSKLIKSEIKDNTLYLDGLSGNYIPPKKNSLNLYIRSLKTLIKNIIGRETSNNLSYKEALKKVIKTKANMGESQLCFKKERIIAKDIKECKKKYPFNYHVSDHILRTYYYLNILNSYIDFSKKINLLEIGGGNGNLISLAKYHLNTNNILNIDLPETLSICIPFIKNLFPDSKMLLPNEIKKKIGENELNEYDFIFLTPSQLSLVDKNLGDLFINTASFQEMKLEQIEIYLDFIQNVAKPNAHFFCTNSVEKVPIDGPTNNLNFKKIKPTRFFEYPFRNNEIIVYQLCELTSLVQNDPAYIRLETIKK